MKRLLYPALILVAGACWAHGLAWTSQSVHTPEPPPRPQAPAGTFYVLSYFATIAPRGPIGWTPGQEVYLDVSRPTPADGKLVAITDGVYSALVPQALLTSDVETAAALRAADEASQEQLRTVNAALWEANRAREVAASVAAAARIDRVNAMLAVQTATSPISAMSRADNVTTAANTSMGLSALRNDGSAFESGNGANSDVAAAALAAQREASRDRGDTIPAGLISRFANDAFHLDYLRDQH